ncbi:MAG TPA: VWA domain-containing protein [Paenibacillus sp.]|uniref:VWA domain-containing protein n=1 Tax=Paenibacillus sp. TaxID=58172 RepID=UPI002C2AF93C|nr:VWA domain-containing protein [Paenibacillus sp.]HUC91241.1 VWA domain-containing protein [Paenibacillus sp.]
MGLLVERPWALLLLLPCAIFVWRIAASTLRLTGGRKAAAVTVRAVILLLLVSIAAGVMPYMEHSRRDTVFVADRSASLNADERLADWLNRAIGSKEENDRAAVVSFGLNAVVERSLSGTAESGVSLRAGVNDSFSNAAGGLQLGSGLLENGGRVVLLSDGEENVGDLLRQGRRLKERGIAVDVVPMPRAERPDAAIESLDVPAALKQGERFTFELTVASTFAGEAELRLYEDNTEKAREAVVVERGENRFALQSVAAAPGFHRYRAELYANGDERSENNTAYAFSRIDGPPAVLVVEGKSGSSVNIRSALEASLIPYDVLQPERLPLEFADYARYDSIILNNVPAMRIAEAPMNHLAAAVRDLGIGLMMTGGEDSYGLGGYFNTPVERALPVSMALQGKRQIPSLGLILVIDRSGSMEGGNLELAKEAALRTVELMRDKDTVGVVAFDDAPWWVMEPVKLTERDSVMSAIRGIQSGGGTDIYPAVNAALTRMKSIKAERKHIILLTDGMSAGSGGYSALTGDMVDNRITMSSVAIGDGADTALLERLAKEAKGRYYFTNDSSTIPAIFSREAVMMSRTYIVEKRFVPQIGAAGDWARRLTSGVPAVDAYVATSAKATAETALVTPMGDPLLARWQYGSGRTVAWTSDVTGRWAKDWTGWPAFPDVFAEWVKWTFPQFSSEPYEIDAALNGGVAELTIREAGGGDGLTAPNLRAAVTDDTGKRTELAPVPNAPGDYSASMTVAGPGVYIANIGGSDGGGLTEEAAAASGGTTAGFVIPYSPEYRLTDGGGREKLERLAAATGGRVLSPERPEEAFAGKPATSRERVDSTRALLIAALVLWLIDIALRRISIPWGRLAALSAGLLPGRRPVGSAAPAAEAALTRLKQRAGRVGAFYGGAAPPGMDAAARGAQAAEQPAGSAGPGTAGGPASAPPAAPGPSGRASAESGASGKINRLLAAKNRRR